MYEVPPNATAGSNVLLMGPSGTGKTYSIGTLVDTGISVYYLALENGLESLLGYYKDRGKPVPDNLKYHVLPAPTASFGELLKVADKIGMLGYDALTKMVDPDKSKYNQFNKLLKALSDFPDDRTGTTHGAVDSWGPDKVLVIDGMTGLSNACMSMVTGGKPVRSQPEWGLAQNQLENFLRLVCDGCKCHFVLLAHVERETDQVLGGVKLMVSTLGRALAPKIPAMFSDVVLTVRSGKEWNWDTASSIADVKTRNLQIESKLPADFKHILKRWADRQS